MQFDRDKFRALVHYIIWKAGDKDGFGATKLNKVLWFSDARAYVLTGKPITGATYIRQKYGPVPRQIMRERRELIRHGLIKIWDDWHYNKKITRLRALKQPLPGALTDSERQIVDYWIEHIANDHTAASISEASHDFAWEIAELGEELPMFAILVERIREEPRAEVLKWAREEARRLGLEECES